MANFPDSISLSKIHRCLSRRLFVRKLATGAALMAAPAIPEALAAPPADPRDLALFHAQKMADALNAVTGGAWEFNLRYGHGFALFCDRGQAEKVAHTVKA